MSSIISGPVGTINVSGGHDLAVQRFILENIAAKAFHDANNTGFELPKCYPGTREAIQRDLKEWVENAVGQRRHHYPVYWLYAPAGSGKTAIAKTLADSFSDHPKKYLLASFFFRRTSSHQNTEERFVATIAHQIKTNLCRTSPFIADAIKADTAIFQKDLRVQADKLILEPLRRACGVATAAERATWPRLLVVDGLDECSGREAQHRILDVVSHLVCQHPSSFPLAIFLSSRPESHIRAAFQCKPLNQASLKICLPDAYSPHADLQKFFTGKFRKIVRAHRHVLPFPKNDWPGARVVHLLVKKSSGQFIYASTVMKYIDVQDDNPVERLKIVLGLGKCPDHENPFADLDSLYIHILASVKPKHLQTVIRVLQVTLSQSDGQVSDDRPWSLQVSLASILDLKRGELEYSLANLDGVLVQTNWSRSPAAVGFYHSSFNDFLLDESRSGPYFIDLSLAHTQFILCLFRYILDDTSDDPISAVRSLLNRLPFAALTEELHRMLWRLKETTTTRKVIRACTTYEGPIGWQLVEAFATRLERFSFNFLDEIRKYVRQELRKYASEGPLCHLVHLFMIDRSISSVMVFDRARFFILSRFQIDGRSLQVDRTSLNLETSLWAQCSRPDCWTFLRRLIKEIYDITPEAYAATCLCVLRCLTDLSQLVISPSDALEFKYLSRSVSYSLNSIEEHLANGRAPPHIDVDVRLLWEAFCTLAEPLLGRASPSAELQKCLTENERVIFLFSHAHVGHGRWWGSSIKGAMDGYLSRCQPFSSA